MLRGQPRQVAPSFVGSAVIPLGSIDDPDRFLSKLDRNAKIFDPLAALGESLPVAAKVGFQASQGGARAF